MGETWNKKEREKKKRQLKKDKEERKLERKEKSKSGNGLDGMMAYIDENGNLSDSPPDPRRKVEVRAEDIVIGVPKWEESDQQLNRKGVVTFFNEAKGYGFIRDKFTQQNIFVHTSELTEPVKEQSKVSFDCEQGPKGLMAVRVKLIR